MRPVPLVGDVALQAVQRVRHEVDGGFARLPVDGLDGSLVQARGRGSHVIEIEGVLFGDTARDDLATLQDLASGSEEQVFAADIVTALDLHRVVVDRFVVSEIAGHPDHFAYRLRLLESPELPEPAVVSGPSFGDIGFGLDDLGLDDLGIDAGVLGDIADIAADAAGAVDAALDAIDTVTSLIDAAAGLAVGNPVQPLQDELTKLAALGEASAGAVSAVVEAFLGDG